MKDFKPVHLEDREIFISHYSKYPVTHSDYSFTNMICWNHYAHYQYAYLKGNLIISSTINGVTRFRPPIGPKDVDILKGIIHLAMKENNPLPLEFIEKDSADWIKSVFPTIEFVPDRDQFDYVYRTQDLAELSNSSYQSIRRVLNKFKANYSYRMESISAKNGQEVQQFLDKWYTEKKKWGRSDTPE